MGIENHGLSGEDNGQIIDGEAGIRVAVVVVVGPDDVENRSLCPRAGQRNGTRLGSQRFIAAQRINAGPLARETRQTVKDAKTRLVVSASRRIKLVESIGENQPILVFAGVVFKMADHYTCRVCA